MTNSFQSGEGRWRGSAEVYDSQGRYAGQGRDARVVRRDLGSGLVEVDVSFEGPFSLSGSYRISDQGDHRRYEGPLNYGYGEALGEGLIDANNYWPDLGLSQRFWLMVMPGGETQLSLALLSRGEQTAYTVVGEYHRSPGDEDAQGQPRETPDAPAEDAEDAASPDASDAPFALSGTWAGTLNLLDDHLAPVGQSGYSERTAQDEHGRLSVSLRNSGFAPDAESVLSFDEGGLWCAGGNLTGSASTWGGRALAGQFLFVKEGLRLWRREVATRSGGLKGVLHTWYRGGRRVGAAYGALEFTPASEHRP